MNNENKKLAIFAVVTAVVVIIVIIISAVIIFGGDDEEAVRSDSASNTGALQDDAVPLVGVEKDSILKSKDSGLNFETYFWVATEEKLGSVDVLTVAFHPKKRDQVTVSTYDDGLFFNGEGINQWEPIEFPPQKIYSFIIDKNDPDYRAFASGVVSKNGRIFRTEDKGQTWRAVYAEPGTNTYVSAIAQDPGNYNLILAGTSAGTLVRSTDGGDTWKNIGQAINGNISHLTHDSVSSSVTYLLAQAKIYHSYDAGLTWLNWEEIKAQEIKDLTARASELYRAGDKAGSQRLKDQVAALRERNKTEKTPSGIVNIVADPNVSGVLYAGLSRGLYRSTDYGKYWQRVNIIESAEKFPIPSIAINPKDSNEISFVAGNSFYRSVNYGVTWAVTPLDKTRNASFVAYDPFDPDTIYVGLSAKR